MDLSTLALFRSAVGVLALMLVSLVAGGWLIVLVVVEWGKWNERKTARREREHR